MSNFYSPDGEEISLNEWSELFEKRDPRDGQETWWRIFTRIDDYDISTVWLGVDHRFGGGGPPLIWETMIFYRPEGEAKNLGKREEDPLELDEYQRRYSTRGEAAAGHEAAIHEVRAKVTVKSG